MLLLKSKYCYVKREEKITSSGCRFSFKGTQKYCGARYK